MINMRTEPEILDLIFQTAKTLQVEAIAMSGSRTNSQAPHLGWTSSVNASLSKRLLLDIAVSTSCSLKMEIELI